MRIRGIAAVVLVAVAALVAVSAVGPAILAEEDPVETAAAEREVRIEFRNEGPDPVGPDADAQARLTLTRNGSAVLSDELAVAAGAAYVTSVPAPAGSYELELVIEVTDDNSRASTSKHHRFDTTGCPGSYRVTLSISVEADANTLATSGGTEGSETGCLAAPTGYGALREEAERVLADPPSGDAITVGEPRAGDAGEFRWRGMDHSPPDVDDSATSFEWRTFRDRPDPWGRTVDGYEVATSYRRLRSDTGGFADHDHDMWFRPQSMSPFAVVGDWGNGFAARLSTLSGTQEIQEIASNTTRYPNGYNSPGCPYRYPLQGRTIHEGDRISVAEFCGRGGDTAVFTAGSVVEQNGLRAIPLYAVRDHNGTSHVSRLWMADGIPYVAASENYWVRSDGPSSFSARHLARFRPGTDVLPEAEPGTGIAPGRPVLDPVDALDGPALDGARERFAYPLDEASRDAREDTSLVPLQSLLNDDDATLAGAVFRVRRDANASGALHADRDTWYLAFTAPDRDPVVVRCERPHGRGPVVSVAVPRADCSVVEDVPVYAWALRDIRAVGRDAVPDRGASFDLAVERWDLVEPGRDDPPVRFAYYDVTEDVLAVGTGLAVPTGTLPTEESEEVLQVHVALDAGRTGMIARGSAWGRTSIVDTPADQDRAPSGLLGTTVGAGGAALPSSALVAAGAATAGILGLLWVLLGNGKVVLAGLYARIRGDDALNHEVRSRIHALVDEEPGIHMSEVEERLDLGHGQADHHLRVLVREGVLSEVRSGGYTRYFVRGTYSVKEMRALAALKGGQNEKAYHIIRSNPGIEVTDLAGRADISVPYASKTAAELADVGLVDKVRDGRRVTLYAMEE